MTGDAVDPHLDVPAGLPDLDRPLGSLDFPLRRTLVADDDRPVSLRGRDARVRTTLVGGSTAFLRGSVALDGVGVPDASIESGAATPAGIERRLRVDGDPVTERVVVPRTGPLCFLEWSADRAVTLPLSWSVPGGDLRWRASDRALVVATPHGRLLYLLSGPGSWSVDRRGKAGLAVAVRLRIPEGGSVRLAVAALGPDEGDTRALRMMGRAALAASARRAEARRLREEGLTVRTGDPALDDALEWEKARAAGLVDGPAARDRETAVGAVSEALLALVAGEHRRALEALGALGADEGRAAAYLFVVARYLAWTGDLASLRGEWDRIGPAVDGCLERVGAAPAPGAPDVAARCHVLALRGMVTVAEEAGDRAMADRLKAAVGAPTPEEGAACWPAEDEEGALVAVVQGLLGVEPDAPRGRLVLRPRPAPDTDGLEVLGLAVGGAAVELAYRREGEVHRFSLRQSRGAAPLQVILEPELVGGRVRTARVDGEPAELDPVPAEGRLRVPVQLVLDRPRRLEVELAMGAQ